MPEIAIGSGLPRNMRSSRSREARSSASARLRSVTSVSVEITQRSPARSTSSAANSTSRTSPPRARTFSSKLRVAPRAWRSALMRARSAGSTSTSTSSSVRPTIVSRSRPKNAHHASFTSTTRLSPMRLISIGFGLELKMRAKSSRDSRTAPSASICAVMSRPTPR